MSHDLFTVVYLCIMHNKYMWMCSSH